MRRKLSVMTMLIVAGMCSLFAQQGQQATEHKTPTELMKGVARADILMIKLGHLALDRTQNRPVRDFARQMIKRHSKIDKQLKKLARREGVDLPNDLTAEQRAMYDRLAEHRGKEFDTEYMQMMVEDHAEDVRVFENRARGKDAEVDEWASKTLSRLEDHLQMAKQTRQEITGRAE